MRLTSICLLTALEQRRFPLEVRVELHNGAIVLSTGILMSMHYHFSYFVLSSSTVIFFPTATHVDGHRYKLMSHGVKNSTVRTMLMRM